MNLSESDEKIKRIRIMKIVGVSCVFVIYLIIMACCYFLLNKECVSFFNELIGVAIVPFFILYLTLYVTSQIQKSQEKTIDTISKNVEQINNKIPKQALDAKENDKDGIINGSI